MKIEVEQLSEIYEKDYFLWLEQTIKLLKNRHLNQIDYDHLIEELEELGNEQKRKVESLLEQIIRHLLLYQYWETEFQYNSHHWHAEIIGFRTQIKRRLTTNLKQYLSQELLSIYADALKFVKAKTQLDNFPQQCPYTFEQILDEDWLPTLTHSKKS
ncbi:DUF29 domain-containing protein [Planktothrix paucivesiculata]|uniref:DUF29 domain-containing protein n=1 Tax=Planktothrix paucivesiculata PCC 9631 TaxID=671071 RepID=A0A7Z9DXZ2_9CYAN|nr:DUF29 domain-containing protein [Planktothrix paucivesiculata]VXD12295.1 conserved hypothetical protein [Planktothrix paucivesiculata PCC 9631]